MIMILTGYLHAPVYSQAPPFEKRAHESDVVSFPLWAEAMRAHADSASARVGLWEC